MWTRPLDFDPGARHAYSNFGYCLLGRVIERATGASYGEAVALRVLRPLGIPPEAMRLGKTLPSGRAPREVAYHDAGRTGPSVFPPVGEPVPTPYGAWNVEAMDAHGGWIASAPALLRFAKALDDPGGAKVLRPETVDRMFDRPPGASGFDPEGGPKAVYYALGWNVRPVEDLGQNTWHTGSLPGTSTLLVRRWDGLSWAVLFNTRDAKGGQVLSGAIDPLVHEAADQVREWPDLDLFRDPAVLGAPGD
jgi:N-acyl-D-amino-acid deacylase